MDLRQKETVRKINSWVKQKHQPFESDDELLEKALWLAELREMMGDKERGVQVNNTLLFSPSLEKKATQAFHKSILLSSEKLHLIQLFKKSRLNSLEKEIFLLITISQLGMFRPILDVVDIRLYLNKGGKDALETARSLSKNGRLIRLQLIQPGYEQFPFEIPLKHILPILRFDKAKKVKWDVKTYDDLLDHTYAIVKTAQDRAELIEDIHRYRDYRRSTVGRSSNDIKRVSCEIDELTSMLKNTLQLHPSWKLNSLFDADLDDDERIIVLVLMGKELGFLSPQDELFTGLGLSRCVSTTVPSVRRSLGLLKMNRPLRKLQYIRVCGGFGGNCAIEDEITLQGCEFELTTEILKQFNIKRQRRASAAARNAVISPKSLILSDKVKKAIEMCICQAQSRKVLFDDWGLAKTMPYGTGVTLIFSGPPGTGKTACAEAIAHQLNKPIIIVNYSEIQNCWVGQTEKNIVRAFREARESDAVLFWDEADAMFYDRESATRNWEIRDVNVLLQEIERFEGVCILATNRKNSLDKALERRISLKVEFERPNTTMQEKIWKLMIPKEMPLDKNVCFEVLSRNNLSGGQIKNAILNAARIALQRGTDSVVTQEDFIEAIEMEKDGGWSGEGGSFGFQKK